MEKCHPLQEGLARPERSASLPLSPHPRRDGAVDPSVFPPHRRPPRLRLRGEPGPGARAGRDGFPPSSGLAPAAPPGLPAHVPPGFLRPRPFGGGEHGRDSGGPPWEGPNLAPWEQGEGRKTHPWARSCVFARIHDHGWSRGKTRPAGTLGTRREGTGGSVPPGPASPSAPRRDPPRPSRGTHPAPP